MAVSWASFGWVDEGDGLGVLVDDEWGGDAADGVVLDDLLRVVRRMTNEDVGLDLLTGAVVNGAGNNVVVGLTAMGGGGEGGLGEHGGTAEMTSGLEGQLPWELAQVGILATDAEWNVTVHVGGGGKLHDSGLKFVVKN